ncbi:hypothetical protein [endosymbiont GvMRE of Glomus versiforme]|uniref:hypothetical protein n=1 Tax=endosymbiont GvMRE of Glomus versiforme TaxID=2039283 RepID=UPI000EE4C7E0|nr:hypothetical protein [endosymbiont GvMRE of Glomus versiforme]RHZ35677.1 hypothetical protein GvMRE_IIg28 [endosymbiont GvMRE of Glomus versiforme]
MINTKQITRLLAKTKTKEYHTKALEELTFDNFDFDELDNQDPQEESSQKASFTPKETPNNLAEKEETTFFTKLANTILECYTKKQCLPCLLWERYKAKQQLQAQQEIPVKQLFA